MENQSALKMVGISKRFPGVCALNNVDLNVKKGQVHAIVGENGAGKSTLMKILCGAYQKDSGEIWLYGSKVEISSPQDAQKHGIAIIYQEFNLAPHLSAAANIFIGREPTHSLFDFIDQHKIQADSDKIFKQLGLDIDVSTEVKNLSVSQQQFTEIAKALSMKPKILIMDEPTSALAEKEINKLFTVMRRIKNEGVTILYISHVLDEVCEIADTISVLRDGKHILTKPKEEITREEIIAGIVGEELLKKERIRGRVEIKAPLLQVKNISKDTKLKNISFVLHKGEILGIAGLLGAGRTELLNTLFGVNSKSGGSVFIEGEECVIEKPSDAIRYGIGYVPEDRKLQGLFLGLATRVNISASYLSHLVRNGLIESNKEIRLANDFVKSLSIKVSSPEQHTLNLSGGNQQKVLLARWLALKPKVLLLDDPTRGIDVGARAAIHELIYQLADKGLGVVFISSELPEIMEVSDRILVIARGQLTGEFSRDEVTKEKILHCATVSHANHVLST